VGGGREMQGVGSPVGWMASAFNQAELFEVVDETDHDVSVNAHQVGKPLLRLTLVLRQVHE
jgi:hypothetical protein